MPTYQYACTTCGEQVEAVQRFTDEPLTVCTACGGSLRKVYSPVGIVFKGSGFYRTDSRSGGSSSSASPSKAGSDSASSDSPSSGGSSPAKSGGDAAAASSASAAPSSSGSSSGEKVA